MITGWRNACSILYWGIEENIYVYLHCVIQFFTYSIYFFWYFVNVGLMFNILKDDVPTDRMEFCVGERITFVCPKQSTVIAWTAPPILMGEIVLLSLSINFVSMPPFNATNLIGRNSTLTVDVFSQLDGVNISCFDRASTGALLSTTIVQVLGRQNRFKLFLGKCCICIIVHSLSNWKASAIQDLGWSIALLSCNYEYTIACFTKSQLKT